MSYYPASIRVRTNPSKKVPRITAFCAESLEYLSLFKWPMCPPNIIIVGWWSYNPGAEAMGALGSVPKITFSRVSSHLFSPSLSSSRLSPPIPLRLFRLLRRRLYPVQVQDVLFPPLLGHPCNWHSCKLTVELCSGCGRHRSLPPIIPHLIAGDTPIQRPSLSKAFVPSAYSPPSGGSGLKPSQCAVLSPTPSTRTALPPEPPPRKFSPKFRHPYPP